MPALTGEQLRYFTSHDKNFFEKFSVVVTKISHNWAIVTIKSPKEIIPRHGANYSNVSFMPKSLMSAASI